LERLVRIWQINDLHLSKEEVRANHVCGPVPEADVAVVVGDVSDHVEANIEWCANVIVPHMPAILIPGNHDMYGRCINGDVSELKSLAASRGVIFLEQETVVLSGVRFTGALLWSDYELWIDADDAERERIVEARLEAAKEKSDYLRIFADRADGRLMTPWDSRRRHKDTIAFLRAELSRPFDGPTVVATHFPAHTGSLQPQYMGDPEQPRYLSDHAGLIEATQPDLWLHGHTHLAVRYHVGRTLVSNNPRGYAHETTGFEWGLVHEIGGAVALAA
jgi:Icc-related predicted phosphoesterase